MSSAMATSTKGDEEKATYWRHPRTTSFATSYCSGVIEAALNPISPTPSHIETGVTVRCIALSRIPATRTSSTRGDRSSWVLSCHRGMYRKIRFFPI
jgi:hypothetical protein